MDFRTLEKELKNLPFVKSAVLAQTYPGGGYEDLSSSVGITFPDGTTDETRIWYNYAVGPDYFNMMDLEFVAGGPFHENPDGRSNQIVMNVKFVRHMGISKMEDAVDKTVKFWGQNWVITGVIKDYHHFGLKTGIEILRYDVVTSNMLVKLDQSALSSAGMTGALTQLKSKWKELFPESTYNYTFRPAPQ